MDYFNRTTSENEEKVLAEPHLSEDSDNLGNQPGMMLWQIVKVETYVRKAR